MSGKPTLHKDGYAEVRLVYDGRGNVTNQLYFGVDGKPTLLKDGNAGWIAEYDERGRETRRAWTGVDGKPTLCKVECAERRREYDDRGNVTNESYFGVDGKPILNSEGYAEVHAEYNERGYRTKESYFGVDGQPICNKNGFAGVRMFYDQFGVITNVIPFDVSGRDLFAQNVVFSKEVAMISPARFLGVQAGDIWCRLGTYDILQTKNIYDVVAAVQAVRNVKKELVVARKVENEYKILTFKFSPGFMGITFDVNTIPDFDKLERAYREYCEKESEKK